MAKCPGYDVRFTNPKARCRFKCRKIIYEYWWASPDMPERNDPNEICTRRRWKVYERGKGPQPPAHINCGCQRKFAFFVCIDPNTKARRSIPDKWDPRAKRGRQ